MCGQRHKLSESKVIKDTTHCVQLVHLFSGKSMQLRDSISTKSLKKSVQYLAGM